MQLSQLCPDPVSSLTAEIWVVTVSMHADLACAAPHHYWQEVRGWGAVSAGALQEFEGALAADPDNRMAGNNRAVCRMYCCNLPGAIQVSCMSHHGREHRGWSQYICIVVQNA